MTSPTYVPATAGQEAIIFQDPDVCRLWDRRPTTPMSWRCPVVAWAIDQEGRATPVLPADVIRPPDSWLMITLANVAGEHDRVCDLSGTVSSLGMAKRDWLFQAREAWDTAHPKSEAA